MLDSAGKVLAIAWIGLVLNFGGACFVNPETTTSVPETVGNCRPVFVHPYGAEEFGGVWTDQIGVFDRMGLDRKVTERANVEATGKLFASFREIPLQAMPSCVEETYRLTWLPTFHSPALIRLTRYGNTCAVVTKRLSGKGAYSTGDLAIEQHREISSEEWDDFKKAIEDMSFRTTEPIIAEPLMNDGASWTLEGYDGHRHHFVHRTKPDARFTAAIRRIVAICGVETEFGKYLSQSTSNTS